MQKQFITLLMLLLNFSSRAQEPTLAITDCNVITMRSENILQHHTILISGDRILKIVPADQWINSNNIRTVSATGKFVMPALADMHTHLNQYTAWMLPLFLKYGVTTIRVMSGSDAVLKYRDSVKQDLKIAPDIHTASQLFDGNPPYWGKLHEGPVIENADSVEQIIVDQMNKGYEFVKIYNRLNPAVVKRIREVCVKRNIALTGHSSIYINKEDILTPQTGELEHLSGYARFASTVDTVSQATRTKSSDIANDLEFANSIASERVKLAAKKTKQFNISNCPTLVVTGIKTDTMFCRELPNSKMAESLSPVLNWWKGLGYQQSANEKKHWGFQLAMIKELYRNKCFLLAGSDSPAPWVVPGLSIHRELEYFVLAGLSNFDALKTATVNPAIWFGKNYDKGTIEAGKRADLLILSANPLEDIRNTQKIEAVIFKGNLLNISN